MPATPEVVGAYLAAAGEGYAMPTLRRRVAAIARAFGVAGHPLGYQASRNPGDATWHRPEAWQPGTARSGDHHDGGPEARPACDTGLAGARDRALLLVGFAGALRRSELVALDVEHVTWTRNGLKLLIQRSKTDAEGEGAEIAIPGGQANWTCPVAALETWLELSKSPLARCSARLTVEGQSNAPG